MSHRPRGLGPLPPLPSVSPLKWGSAGVLLWDYVPWEQMTKQRRGIMWALQTVKGLDRTLILPPFRFHTSKDGEYEYVRYSDLFELAPLQAINPVADLADYAAASQSRVDLVFSLQRGLPPGYKPGAKPSDTRHWIEGECSAPRANQICEVDEQGEERCATPMASFAGHAGGLNVANLTCGWAPDMRWDRILRASDVRGSPSIGLHGIVYQVPPPLAMNAFGAYLNGERTGKPCGLRFPYPYMRGAMQYRVHLVETARQFLASARQRHAAGMVAQQRGEISAGSGVLADIASGDVGSGAAQGGDFGSGEGAALASAAAAGGRVLAVHWRRGDFLARAGVEHTCVDVASGDQIFEVNEAGALSATPCTKAPIVLTPQQLAEEVRAQLVVHNASLVFLASNAKPAEITELQAALRGIPLVQFDPGFRPLLAASQRLTQPQSSSSSQQQQQQQQQQPPSSQQQREDAYSNAELAVIDTLVCALADAFLGTRRSMFSWNILEERVLQGMAPGTGALMGMLSQKTRKPRALTKSMHSAQRRDQEAQSKQ